MSKNKGGRPIKEIDWDQFDKLCAIQSTLREIAAWFNVSEDTIERAIKRNYGVSFADYFGQKRGKGLIPLRRKQYELAMSGNVTLLIWLGKQYLNQSDKIEEKQEIKSIQSTTYQIKWADEDEPDHHASNAPENSSAKAN